MFILNLTYSFVLLSSLTVQNLLWIIIYASHTCVSVLNVYKSIWKTKHNKCLWMMKLWKDKMKTSVRLWFTFIFADICGWFVGIFENKGHNKKSQKVRYRCFQKEFRRETFRSLSKDYKNYTKSVLKTNTVLISLKLKLQISWILINQTLQIIVNIERGTLALEKS